MHERQTAFLFSFLLYFFTHGVSGHLGGSWWALILAIFGSAALCGFAGYFFICRRMQARSQSEDFSSKVITAPDTPWMQHGHRNGSESSVVNPFLNSSGGTSAQPSHGMYGGRSGGGGGGEGNGAIGAGCLQFAQTPVAHGTQRPRSSSHLSNNGPRDFRQALMHDDEEARDILIRSRVLYDDHHANTQTANEQRTAKYGCPPHRYSSSSSSSSSSLSGSLNPLSPPLGRDPDGEYEAVTPDGGSDGGMSNAQLLTF